MDEELPRYIYPLLAARLLLNALLICTLCVLSNYTLPNLKALQAIEGSVSVVSAANVTADTKSAAISEESSAQSSSDSGDEYPFDGIIEETARRYQVDPALVKAIIMAESGYNPRAVSKKGAQGLMQLMPDTAESLGVEDSFNPEENIDAGVRYLKLLMKRFGGNTELALAAYNAGARKVRIHRGVPPFQTTRYYIAKVFEYYEHFKSNAVKETNKV